MNTIAGAIVILTVSTGANATIEARGGPSRAAQMAVGSQPASNPPSATVAAEAANRQATTQCLNRGLPAETCRDRQPEGDEELNRRQVEAIEARVAPAKASP